MENLISEEGLDQLINDLYNGAKIDIGEVDNMLKRYYDQLGAQDNTNDTALTVLGESINNLLRNKYSARDQLFKVANLVKDRVRKKEDAGNGMDKVFSIHELRKRIEEG